MSPGLMKTKEIHFSTGEISTDSLLYREKCDLLLPEPFTQTLFYATSDNVETKFYISSDSDRNMESIESFFSRLYGAFFEEVDFPVQPPEGTVTLKNSLLNFRKKEFYHPRLIRNVLDLASIYTKAKISYCVSLRSSHSTWRGAGRFNFSLTVGFSSGAALSRFRNILGSEIRDLRKEEGFRMKVSKNLKMRDNLLTNPFNLINFVRIPSEQDHII